MRDLRPRTASRGLALRGAWVCAAALVPFVVSLLGCELGDSEECDYSGEVDLRLTPRKGDGALDGVIRDLPAFAAPQGVPASEVDFELRGVDPETITTLRVTVVVDGLGLISDTTYTPASMGLDCGERGGLWAESVPVAYIFPVSVVEDLEGSSGTLSVEVSGMTDFAESYPVDLRVTSY